MYIYYVHKGASIHAVKLLRAWDTSNHGCLFIYSNCWKPGDILKGISLTISSDVCNVTENTLYGNNIKKCHNIILAKILIFNRNMCLKYLTYI